MVTVADGSSKGMSDSGSIRDHPTIHQRGCFASDSGRAGAPTTAVPIAAFEVLILGHLASGPVQLTSNNR
jgi:hypothetical protein